MKKYLVLFLFAFFALNSATAFAQQSSCQVSGLQGVVATVTPLVKAIHNGSVGVTVSLSSVAPQETGVAVEIYDDKVLVASDMVYIPKGNKSAGKDISGAYIESGKMYMARIANASCQVPGIQLP